MVEHNLAKVGVAGPNPVFRSRKLRVFVKRRRLFFYAIVRTSVSSAQKNVYKELDGLREMGIEFLRGLKE